MTKRFKHIPTGDIYKKDNYSYYGPFQIVPQSIVENKNSKDWEEVKENTYRIVKVRNKNEGFLLTYNGEICIHRTDDLSIISTGSLSNVSFDHFDIYEVERVSDKQLFSIGDNTDYGIIKEFTVSANNIVINFENSNIGAFLQNVKKIETPILITEDGVKCYANNHPELFWVDLVNWETGTDSRNKFRSTEEIFTLDIKYFALKQNRDEWIINNKPLFSIKDIETVYVTAGQYNKHDPERSPRQAIKLREIGKSRL